MESAADDLYHRELWKHMNYDGPKETPLPLKDLENGTTMNGDTIHIKQISDAHLKNSIALIKRRQTWRQAWLTILEQKLKQRSDER